MKSLDKTKHLLYIREWYQSKPFELFELSIACKGFKYFKMFPKVSRHLKRELCLLLNEILRPTDKRSKRKENAEKTVR